MVKGCTHNLTNTQAVVDAPNTKKSDLRRARWVKGGREEERKGRGGAKGAVEKCGERVYTQPH